MCKKLIFICLLIGLTANLKAQVYLDNLYKQANEMATAVSKGDYKTLLKYTHPKIIKQMGGTEKATQTLKQAMLAMKQQGLQFDKVSIGKVGQTIKSTKDIQSIVPQILDMKFGTKTIHSNSYLLGISYDAGKNWYFLDTGTTQETELRKMFPEINSKIVIPKSSRSFN
ncbi:MAG: hypothetical protein EOO91_14465 [Pedobacter sp.]|nr:MAG: hypothetical protein EOO91_14465 [Pedobacter sp.]